MLCYHLIKNTYIHTYIHISIGCEPVSKFLSAADSSTALSEGKSAKAAIEEKSNVKINGNC